MSVLEQRIAEPRRGVEGPQRKTGATYIPMGGHGVVSLDRIRLPSSKNDWASDRGLGSVWNGSALRRRLKHDAADVEDTLCDRIARAGDGYSTFRAVGKHVGSYLDARASHFADLLDFRPPFADERPAL